MKKTQIFLVDLSSLENQISTHQFHIDDSFFQKMDQNLVEKGDLEANVILHSSQSMIKADIEINGWVELECDRSLNHFKHPIKAKNTIFFKFSDKNEELTDEIVLIKYETKSLDMASILFDFIGLNIPIKKIHPDLITEEEAESDEDILIYSSVNNQEELADNNIDILDPRWEALKKLKDSF